MPNALTFFASSIGELKENNSLYFFNSKTTFRARKFWWKCYWSKLKFFGRASFSYSTISKPSERLIAVSTLSANLLPRFEFRIIPSTIIDISCFTFLFKFGKSSILIYFPSTFILETSFFIIQNFLFIFTLPTSNNRRE